jgi:ABC-type transport system substrate-binding protein
MTKRFCKNLFSLAVITAFLLAGCNLSTQQTTNLSTFSPLKVSAENCNYGGEIKSVAAVDEYTVRFTLCSPDASFPAKISSPIFAVQDRDFLNANQGDSKSLTKTINGTGPYQLISNNPVGQIQLHSSASYWGVPPSTQTLNIKFLLHPSEGPSLEELYGTDATTSFTLSTDLTNTLGVTDTFIQLKHVPLDLVYLGFNNQIKPMDNVNVRKAFAMTVDRARIVGFDLPIGTGMADQMIPMGVTPGRTGRLTWYAVDTTAAHQLLVDSGFDFNQELTLAYVDGAMDYISTPRYLAEEIQSELAVIQVKVTLKPMTQSDFDQALANGTLMMFVNSFSALYPDGAAFYEYPFIRQAKQFGSSYPDLSQDLSSVQSEQDKTVRQAKFDLLNQKFKDLVPLIPIGNVPEWSFFRNTVNNEAVNGFYENYENITTPTNTLQVLESNRPASLWPADETDLDTFRITRLLYDTLVSYNFGDQELTPDLADSWESNTNATQWTFALRYGVKFTDGANLDANDVVASFSAIWNTADVNHKGRSGNFTFFQELFGPLLNAPAK